MNRSNRLRSLFVASMLGLGLCVSVAEAGPRLEFASLKVSYGDLDLSRRTDVQRLYERLQQASANVCRPVARTSREFADFQECAGAALDRAVQLIDSPELVKLHASAKSRA